MSDLSPAVAAPPQEKPTSPFSRIIGVLISPRTTFEEIARKPDWVVPAIVIIAVMLVATIVTVPRIDFDGMYREAFEAKGVSGPQMDQALRIAIAFGKATMYVQPFLLLGGLAVAALLYWLGTRMLGGAATYLQAFSVVLYGFMPQVIRTLIQIPVVMTKHGLHMQDAQTVVRSSPAFLVNFKENPVLWAFLNRFDLFLIWSLILIVIGLATASRLSKAKAAVVVFIVWCLGTLFAVGGGAMAKLRATK